MRTSFHHQLEAQPPNLPVCRTGEPQYPIYRNDALGRTVQETRLRSPFLQLE